MHTFSKLIHQLYSQALKEALIGETTQDKPGEE